MVRSLTFRVEAAMVRRRGLYSVRHGHYIQNIGDKTVRFLEIFKSDRYEDVSLKQWMALTSPELEKAHLHLGKAAMEALAKKEELIFLK